MKKLVKISLIAALIACISAPVLTVNASAATPTGFTKAEDVTYLTTGGYLANWGVRDEACAFLSTYAENFYTGSYVYSVLSETSGGSSQSNAPQSALYKSLQTLMKSKHSHITTYDETRPLYRYTDCEANDTSKISSFYSQKAIGPAWDSGKTWNREHTWPNSKGLGGKDENDIMMLRPTSVSENSSRGNKAYGESSGYYDPGESVRGDCARIVLYTYVRWGNTSYMWGTKGVMENLNVLLDWMEEDPVDTWEMGRNDAVQYITGTRNVFIDYPEYAWLLFGEEVPKTLTTPSGEAKNGETTAPVQPDQPDQDAPPSEDTPDDVCEHEYSRWFVTSEPTETTNGERWRFCTKCSEYEKEILPKTSGNDENGCAHQYGDWVVIEEPTETREGLRMRRCAICKEEQEESIPKIGENDQGGNVSLSCNSSIVSPFAVTLLLAGAYVFLRKK